MFETSLTTYIEGRLIIMKTRQVSTLRPDSSGLKLSKTARFSPPRRGSPPSTLSTTNSRSSNPRFVLVYLMKKDAFPYERVLFSTRRLRHSSNKRRGPEKIIGASSHFLIIQARYRKSRVPTKKRGRKQINRARAASTPSSTVKRSSTRSPVAERPERVDASGATRRESSASGASAKS